MDFYLNNGKPKVTAIQRFDHLVILLGPKYGDRREFETIDDLKQYVQRRGWEINVSHLHPAQNKKVQN